MPADLVIRGGLVVDGTGAPARRADVEITAGRITDVGTKVSAARRVIDATSLVVAPGFIDTHTHYDAQLFYEPSASPASWHGVTSIVMGNCGFTLAPCRDGDTSFIRALLSQVEEMPHDAVSRGVTFEAGAVDSYLESLDGAIGVNAAFMVGHSSVRRWVMGEAASERAATNDEIADMASLVSASIAAGAIGFSSSQVDIHKDHLGRPVPSNFADPPEIVALAGALAGHRSTNLEFFCRSFAQVYSDDDRRLLRSMSRASGGRPIHLNAQGYADALPDGWKENLRYFDASWRRGIHLHPMARVNSPTTHFALATTFLFDEVPSFRAVLGLPLHERPSALADPTRRDEIHRDFRRTEGRAIVWDWDTVLVTEVGVARNASLIGRSVGDVARERRVDALDAFLDLAVDDEFRTVFARSRAMSPDACRVRDELLSRPYVLAGASDGGAHIATFCGADYPTRLLTEAVTERFTFEDAVARLTSVPASIFGFEDRGVVRPGAAADLVVLDRASLAVGPVRVLGDFPGGGQRLVVDARGYEHVIVNGETLVEKGEPTGLRPGRILRSATAAERN